MREKTRQMLLQRGAGLTKLAVAQLIAKAQYKSWSGCVSGCDWCGTKVYVNDKIVSGGSHQQNDSPTGYEQRGLHRVIAPAVTLKVNDRIIVATRTAAGRDGYGDTFYRTVTKGYVVV